MPAFARLKASTSPANAARFHAVLGENGAGKSTLIKIIAGVVQPDSGRMRLAGSEVSFATPSAANAAGVVCIFQELSLMPDLSVADNISIASPPRRFGLIDAKAQRRRAEELLSEIGCEDVNPLRRVRDLPLSRRQVVEIAKALGKRPQLLILDEATSALTSADVEKVYAMLARLKAEGVAILYISPPHARGRGARRPGLGVSQRPPYRDLRQGEAFDRRYHPAHDWA
ncbi:ABC-type sugar transport system ATPase subunit [Bradyrhizobium sp. GM2.4]